MKQIDGANLSIHELQEHFQNSLMRLSNLTCMVLIAFEFILCFLKYGIQLMPADMEFDRYIRFYLIRPIVALLLLASFNGLFYLKSKRGELLHTSIPLSFLSEVLTIIIAVHYRYPVIYCIMVFPVLMSTVYGSEKVLRRVFLVEMIGLLLDTFYIHVFTDFFSRPPYFNMSLTLVLVISLISLLFVRYSIRFEKYKLMKMSEELVRNKNLEVENKELEQDSRMDGLSKLPNYKYLVETANKWVATKSDICFCMIDLDDFKKVNDTMGHEFGNVVIYILSRELEKLSNENIFVARYGGEEFGILTTGLTEDEVFRIMDDCRQRFSQRKYRETSKQNTFSGGISSYRKNMAVTDLFKAADKMLYEAKSSGKNCIFYSKNSGTNVDI
ncbi:MAG: GGDEF domain-containing protein [Lachnospiraceae bacterium]|nr:GGDEF domain-containing protein [Lachnospiraceae bacterium]